MSDRPSTPPPVPRASGWAGAVFGFLLLATALGSAVAGILALVGLLQPSPVASALERRGLVAPGASVQAFHDHSSAADGSSGCMLVDDTVVRFDAGEFVARIPTASGRVRVEERPLRVELEGPEGQVICPFRLGEGADAFAQVVSGSIQRTTRDVWRPVDPRVRHLYEGGRADRTP